MSNKENIQIENLYTEGNQWSQNLGDKTIHAKRMGGKFRILKWIGTLVWLPFFLLPYITWNNRQAVLFDVDSSQYHLFNITVFSQDLWMLSLILLFLAVLLAVITVMLGRVFCGYFCFQTVWTDIFTKIEEFFEGPPNKRRLLDDSPWDSKKIKIKISKHLVWISIAVLSGVTWMLYFGVEWSDYIDGSVTLTTIVITTIISGGAYIFAGFMREQSCLWVCPYARIQGVMLERKTIIPTYDYHRGESRGKLKNGVYVEGNGDCIECNQCKAVCPTGVDIREGQEYGCITCGLCIDACNSVMEKVGKPKGLIRYTSLDAMEMNKPDKPLYKRKRVWGYFMTLFVFLYGIAYSLSNISSIDLKVIHSRQPAFVKLSDGSISNKYEIKIMNKDSKVADVKLSYLSEIIGMKIRNKNETIRILSGQTKVIYVYLTAFEKNVGESNDVIFVINNGDEKFKYKSIFITPMTK